MAISSKQNSIRRMTRCNEYFEIGEPFLYSPLVTMKLVPGEVSDLTLVPIPSKGHSDPCGDCALYNFCGRGDNMFGGLYFVPSCEPSIRDDNNSVIFVEYGGVK